MLSVYLPTCLLNSISKDTLVGCVLIIKVKTGERTELHGDLPSSLIIQKRPINLQTAGIITNLFLSSVADSLSSCLSVHECVSHFFWCIVSTFCNYK